MSVSNWLRKSSTGRAILVAGAALLVILGLQFYYLELPKQQEAAQRTSGVDALETAADSLEEQSKAGTFTRIEVSEWFPTNYQCGREAELKDVAPEWTELGFKNGDKTQFQYRLDTSDKGYRMIARTDSDCDGIYAIHTITGSTDWTSTFTRRSESQNLKE